MAQGARDRGSVLLLVGHSRSVVNGCDAGSVREGPLMAAGCLCRLFQLRDEPEGELGELRAEAV